MRLGFQPGPLKLLQVDVTPLLPELPVFAQMVATDLQELPGDEILMDADLAAAGAFDPTTDIGVLDGSLLTADLGSADIGTVDPTLALPALDTGMTDVGNGMIAMNAQLPQETWAAVPAQGSPPSAYLLPGSSAQGGIGLENLDSGGSRGNQVGDRFTIHVYLFPTTNGQSVAGLVFQLYINVNGVNRPAINLPATDSGGLTSYSSTFAAADVGTWEVSASDNGVAGGAIANNWTVGAAPPPPPTLTVVLQNLTNPATPTVLHVGDLWEITVTGAPRSNVQVGYYPPTGGVLSGSIGSTDDHGILQISGVISTETQGAWREAYQVGSDPNQVVISFTVAP